MDFFIAGVIPIGATLDFLVLMMLLHPEVQQKAQKEIDSVVGRNRLPQLIDKTRYVCMTVEEHRASLTDYFYSFELRISLNLLM
jgi:cytochrome P450